MEHRLGDLSTWWNINWMTYRHRGNIDWVILRQGSIKNVWLVDMVEYRLGDL